MLRDLRRRSGADDRSAGVAALGAEVDEPVGSADDVEVVLDHDQRMPRGDQLAEGGEQFRDVVEMQAGRGLIEQKQRAARSLRLRGRLDQMPGELQPLRLAAGERRHRLADAQVLEPDVGQRRERRFD